MVDQLVVDVEHQIGPWAPRPRRGRAPDPPDVELGLELADIKSPASTCAASGSSRVRLYPWSHPDTSSGQNRSGCYGTVRDMDVPSGHALGTTEQVLTLFGLLQQRQVCTDPERPSAALRGLLT